MAGNTNMTRFEYLSVLVSIVIALGISDLTIAWARVLQYKMRVDFYWLHAFWSVFSIFLMVQFWWAFWRYRTVTDWSLGAFVMVLAAVIALTFCALMLSPRIGRAEKVDSQEIYFSHARAFLGFGCVFVTLAAILDILVLESPLFHAENIFRGLGAVGALVVAFSRNKVVHEGFAAIALLAAAGFLATSTVY